MRHRWLAIVGAIYGFVGYAVSFWFAYGTGEWQWWFATVSCLGCWITCRIILDRTKNEHRRREGNYRSANSGASYATEGITFTYLTYRAEDSRTGVVYEIGKWPLPVQRMEEKTMETKRQEDPVKGWKVANIYFHEDGRVLFSPLVQSMIYEPEGYAKCTFVEEVYRRLDLAKLEADGWEITNDHGPVPSPQCTCGFYAMKQKHECHGDVHRDMWVPVDTGYPLTEELVGFTCAGTGILEVEFYGKIINAARGVRAEYQRVLCVYTYPPQGKDTTHPLPNVQVDWKWLED